MEIEKGDWEKLVEAFDVWACTAEDDTEADAEFALAAQKFVEDVQTSLPIGEE